MFVIKNEIRNTAPIIQVASTKSKALGTVSKLGDSILKKIEEENIFTSINEGDSLLLATDAVAGWMVYLYDTDKLEKTSCSTLTRENSYKKYFVSLYIKLPEYKNFKELYSVIDSFTELVDIVQDKNVDIEWRIKQI